MISVNLSTSEIIQDPSLDANYWPRFLMQAFIILVLCRVIGKLFSYIHQPAVVGEIIGGILVGPSVLGQWDWWKVHVFPPASISPTSSNYFTLVASVGLVLFMFCMGLELDEKLVKRMGRTSFPIAFSSIIIPFGIGIAFSNWLYEINNDYLPNPIDKTAFLLFTGAAMSFTALPVLASLLNSTRLIRTPVGVQAISCATIDDVLAWCTLAISTSFASGNSINGLYTFLLAVAYILIMVFVCRPLLRRLHDYCAKDCPNGDTFKYSPMFTFVMVLFLLAAAFWSEILQIHSFFGSFVAGLVAPKHGSWHIQVAEKIEFPVTQIMLPLYFASSGMRTNIGSISTPFLGGVTVAVFAIATVAKFVPGTLMTKIVTKKDWRFCITMGTLMNTRGLVELIALNIGFQLGILSQPMFTIFVIMAVVTTFITCPTVYLIYTRYHEDEIAAANKEFEAANAAHLSPEATLPLKEIELAKQVALLSPAPGASSSQDLKSSLENEGSCTPTTVSDSAPPKELAMQNTTLGLAMAQARDYSANAHVIPTDEDLATTRNFTQSISHSKNRGTQASGDSVV